MTTLRGNPLMLPLTLLLAAVTVSPPQEPLRIGVVAVDAPDSVDVLFLRGVRRAVEANAAAGKIELTVVPANTPAEAAAAVEKLRAAGVAGIVAPPNAWLAEATRKAAGPKLPCAAFAATPVALVQVLDRLVDRTFCMTRVGLVRDQSKGAREFGKLLEKGLTAPSTLLCEIDVAIAAKALAKQFEKERPELLVIDADPPAVVQFLTQALPADAMPVVLTPRALGEQVRALPRRLFLVHGQAAASSSTTSAFRADYERDHGVPLFGVAEGYEGTSALVRACRAAPGGDAAAIQAALAATTLEGIRGRYAFEPAAGAFVPPLAVWLLAEDNRWLPYVPGIVALQAVGASAGTDGGGKPQAAVGEPFGTWRTRQFAPEEGAQWVICSWADDAGYATIADDLRQLGLSTGGVDPLADHLVREEILARVLAIVSTKFGRREDGTGIAGKSLRIVFAAHVAAKEREKRRLRVWPARFGGDHSEAGGEAFGTFCRVYSTFIRRTIFQKHALVPPLTTTDCEYLDGTYRFGSDLAKDKRSELIRALINSFAGSMALTLAHEVGHLAGLGHVTDDPAEIMNVDEGGGIDYRDARFGPGSWATMQERYGLTGDKPGKGEKVR